VLSSQQPPTRSRPAAVMQRPAAGKCQRPTVATTRAMARRGRSLTSCRGATSVLAGMSTSQYAEVAQLVARDFAKVEATGSSPVFRSIPGVPVHKHWLTPLCMCSCRGTSAATRLGHWAVACGHSRNGSHALVAQQAEQPPCKRQAARSNRRRGHQTRLVRLAVRTPGFHPGDRGFESRT
jgi:hypothetical protein